MDEKVIMYLKDICNVIKNNSISPDDILDLVNFHIINKDLKLDELGKAYINYKNNKS